MPDSRTTILERILGKEGADDSAPYPQPYERAPANGAGVQPACGKPRRQNARKGSRGRFTADTAGGTTARSRRWSCSSARGPWRLPAIISWCWWMNIREGQLNGIFELANAQSHLLEKENPENEAIITGVKTYPDFEEVFKEIKGEQDEQPIRHARRA